MDHSEAVKQMAAERYVLDELTPDAREAFEEHVFDCHECALDLRAAAAFVNEAKVQLPELAKKSPAPTAPATKRRWVEWDRWLSWGRPAFAVPAFAALLLVVGYQNLVTLPTLRTEVSQPRLLPWAPLHGATRGGPGTAIAADREHGLALPIDISQQPEVEPYASYSFDLFDGAGKHAWTGAIAAPRPSESGSQRLLLEIPGAMLRSGAYTVTVSGAGLHGERTQIDKYTFNLAVTD